jgi:hypothetical protein
MIRRALLVVSLAVLLVLALGLLLADRNGWATPFGLPHQITLDGRTYYDGDANVPEHFPCTTNLPTGYRPLRPTGSVFGYLTGDASILLPHYEWGYSHAFVLYVRNGSCLQQYVDIAHEG